MASLHNKWKTEKITMHIEANQNKVFLQYLYCPHRWQFLITVFSSYTEWCVRAVHLLHSLFRYLLFSLSFSRSLFSFTTMHFSTAVILPAAQSGPCFHGDGVSMPLPGIGTPEICCLLGLLPSLPICMCQCVVHWKTVKSMTDTQDCLQLCSKFYTWLLNMFGIIVQTNL